MIHKVFMTAAMTIIGSYCFKQTTNYILTKCNMLTAKQLITYSAILFTHKITTNKLPTSNYSKYLPPNRRTTNMTIRTRIRPKSKKSKNHIVHKGAELLNLIDNNIRILPLNKFKKRLRSHVKENDLWDPGGGDDIDD